MNRSACVFLIFFAATSGSAAELIATSISHNAFQLTAAAPVSTRTFDVDKTALLMVNVAASSRTLVITLQAPSNGTTYTLGSLQTATFASAFKTIDPRGAAYAATISNPATGSWTLTVRDTAAVAMTIDVLVTYYFNNATRLVLAGGGATYRLGSKVRLALAAFDGSKHLTGVTVAARMFRPSDPTFTPVPVTFQDDGKNGDETANDGIYETLLTPVVAGTYQVQANVTGTASTGAFRRTAATTLTFAPVRAQIIGVTDRGSDDDGDGLVDRVVVAATAKITEAGKYMIVVRLSASNGHELEAATEMTLPTGSTPTDVSFRANDLINGLGVDGPYTVAEVRYYAEIKSDFVLADSRDNLGVTGAYRLDGLQHPPLRLDPAATSVFLHKNAFSEVDYMFVNLVVICDIPGTYTWAGTLVDRNDREIGFTTATSKLVSGRNPLGLAFVGKDIGLNKVDGPYFVTNFTVFDGTHSLVVNNAFTTEPYAVSIFEGYQPPRRRAVRH
jgi:hypothetical protein